MSRRTDFLSQAEAASNMNINRESGTKTSVDSMVDAIEKAYTRPESTVINSSDNSNEEIQVNPNFIRGLQPRELKTVHRNYIVPESISKKLAALAKQRGVSENALVNEIFKNVFNS